MQYDHYVLYINISYIQHNVNMCLCFLLLTSCIMYPFITMQCDHCITCYCITSMYHILYKEWTCIVNIDVLCTNGVRYNAVPPHSHPQLDFHHFAITFQMDRGNCDNISLGQGLHYFFDFKFLVHCVQCRRGFKVKYGTNIWDWTS